MDSFTGKLAGVNEAAVAEDTSAARAAAEPAT